MSLVVFFLAALIETVAPGDIAAIFSADDYPAEARDRNIQGQVIAEVDVSADGMVTDCRVKQSAGSALLDSTTCRLIRERGKFVESRKRSPGQRMTLSVPVRWTLQAAAIPVDVMIHRIIFTVAKGEAGACRSEVVAGAGILGDACKAARAMAEVGVRRLARDGVIDGKEYVLEMATLPGDHRDDNGIGEKEGEFLLSLQTLLLRVGASGAVAKCDSSTNAEPRDYAEQWCKGIVANEQYPPLEADIANRTDREITRVNAIYLRAPIAH